MRSDFAPLPPTHPPPSLRLVPPVQSDSGILPIGKSSALDPLRTTVVYPSEAVLLNQLLAVSYATSEKQVPHVNVAGFVHVCVNDGRACAQLERLTACRRRSATQPPPPPSSYPAAPASTPKSAR